MVDTDYIFHCEDDWEFYRGGFIEDSLRVLESNKYVYQVWLRSFYHDIKRDYPFHSLGEKFSCDKTVYNKLLSSNPKWQGFSFNPGLRRKSDYLSIKGGYASFLDESNSSASVESALSSNMKSLGMYAAILENDAVAHTGYDSHIQDINEKKKSRKKKKQKILIALVVFLVGLVSGLLI